MDKKNMQETIVDPRKISPEEHAEGVRQAQTLFKLNHTMPYTDEYNALVKDLFRDNLGAGGWIMPGLLRQRRSQSIPEGQGHGRVLHLRP